jgi:6-phosphofructokinase 1
VPLEVVSSRKKVVDVGRYYVPERLRPRYENFENRPVFIMTSDY